MNVLLRFTTCVLCVTALFCCGCAPDGQSARFRLESYDPAERIRAIRDVVKSGDDSLVPALVDRLDDDDAAVRFYAILALEKFTDTRRGYSYSGSIAERSEAIDEWRAWLESRDIGSISTPDSTADTSG